MSIVVASNLAASFASDSVVVIVIGVLTSSGVVCVEEISGVISA